MAPFWLVLLVTTSKALVTTSFLLLAFFNLPSSNWLLRARTLAKRSAPTPAKDSCYVG